MNAWPKTKQNKKPPANINSNLLSYKFSLTGRSMCAPEHFNPWTSFKHKTNQKMPVSKEPFHSLKSGFPKKPLKSLAEL